LIDFILGTVSYGFYAFLVVIAKNLIFSADQAAKSPFSTTNSGN